MSEGGWRRLFGWFWDLGDEPPRLPEPAEPEPSFDLPRSKDEVWLDELIADVAEERRIDDIGNERFWGHIDGLWKAGHEQLAAEWVTKLIDVPVTPESTATELRLRLVDMCDRRGDLADAAQHLEALTFVPDHATRAHYLLAEHYRRLGEEALALRHYETVLARDVDYPNVRARVERLRAARGRHAPGSMGETIAGPEAAVSSGSRYLLVRELGRGATAVVYLARDVELEREVAVKLLHPHLAAAHRAGALARFFDEARVCASLRHPNIVAILDLDEMSRRIVMELAAGGTLRAALHERGPRPIQRALERHTQILSALLAAHRRGIVHRDLKPGNLMFRRDPNAPGTEIMLGDFGVAHLPDAEDNTASGASAERRRDAIGTLGYMSPEQRDGRDVSERSDLFSAAVVLFEMLTGRLPWTHELMLAGVRHRGDFELPPTLFVNKAPELATLVQDHLDALGDPSASSRPASDEALDMAIEMRDIATAELV